jgi:hypothetical protein
MEKSCGLDVHKESVFACILDEQGKKILEKCSPPFTFSLNSVGETPVIFLKTQ